MAQVEKLVGIESPLEVGQKINEIIEKGVGGAFNIFDTMLKDHVLSYEESYGWALQGTYVYKEAVAGSRYGYPDFYNKCVEEFESGEKSWLKSNVTKVGSLVDNQGVLSEFSNSNYAVLPMTFAPTNNDTWEMVFKTTLSGFGSTYYLIGSGGTSAYNTGVTLSVSSSGYLNLYATSNGSSWNIAGGVSSSIALSTGTYYVKVEFTGSQYVVSVSSDGDSYVNHITVSSTTPVYKATSPNALGHEHGSAAIYRGTIDLNECYINVNGQRFWSGTDTITKNPNGHLFYDIADKAQIDDLYNTNGIAWYYGIDKENERIFLPRTKHFAFTGGVMGNGNALGLTGGTGSSEWNGNLGNSVVNLQTQGIDWSQHLSLYTNATSDGTTFGITTDPTKSGITLETDDSKYLYICVGNTNVESAVTDVVDVTTTENDTMPLGYSTYQNGIVPNTSWLKSQGQWNDGNVYTTFYNEFVQKIGQQFASGYVKEITEEYDDYDLVINQDDMTFRLPLLDGSEDLVNYDNSTTYTAEFIAPSNGYLISRSHTDGYGTVNLRQDGHIISSAHNNTGAGTILVISEGFCSKGGVITKEGQSLWGDIVFYPLKGNGSLYFKVANAVQNLELLDAGEVLEAVNNVVPNNRELITGWSFPSNKYIDLTLNASGSTYTAPANGWVSCVLDLNAGGNMSMQTSYLFDWHQGNSSYGSYAGGIVPVRKGSTFLINYSNARGTVNFRFVYAEGEQ